MWTELIIWLLGIPILIGYIIVRIKLSKSIEKMDISANAPLVENDYRKEFTQGYTLGVLRSKRTCKNGCSRIEFYPIDVEQGEFIPRPEVQSFIVKEEFIKPFSKGELSDYRERMKTITRNPLLIPSKLKDTTEGKWATKEGQLGWLMSEFGKTVPAGDEAISELIKEQGARGEMSKAEIARLREHRNIRAKVLDKFPEQQEEVKK